MAKKKRKKKRSSYPKAGKNSHHLLWQRRKWDEGDLKALRSYSYCIIEIPANTLHRKIHENVRQIPPPSQENARRVLWNLKILAYFGGISEKDSIEKRLRILITLFDDFEPETTGALKKQLKVVDGFNKGS